jgi:hypothetical protein
MKPFEAWIGEKLDVTHFYIYGSCAWTHILSEKRKELDPHSTRYTFVKYPNNVKGYRLVDPSTNWLIIEHNVQFEESPFHAPPMQHTYTLDLPLVPDIGDDDSIHSDATYSDSNLEYYVHGLEQVVRPYEDPMLELQRMPKWA